MRTGRPPSVEGNISSPYVDQVIGGLHILRVYRDRVMRGGRLQCRLRCSVQCICGNNYDTDLRTIISGRPSSCGCRNQRALLHANTKHGYAANGHSRTYRAWLSVKERVLNPNSSAWKDYGGRGIQICPEWLNFESFLRDMGECPAGRTIDRIDVDGHYTPENCRWATAKVQMNNTRTNVRVLCNGVSHTLAEWADILEVPYRFLWTLNRKKGVPIDQVQELYIKHCHGKA